MELKELLLILSVILTSAGLVFAFRSSSSGVAFAYLGVNLLRKSEYAAIDTQALLFWAAATLIVLFIPILQRNRKKIPYTLQNYIVGGAFVGMLVGITFGQAGMTSGSAIGAVLGGIACNRICKAKTVHAALRYSIISVGLPSIVTMSVIGIGLFGLLHK